MSNASWSLNESNFTYLDRLKICLFFLDSRNRWTQANHVFEYENLWKGYTGSKYVLAVSSGSTANTLIAQYATKDLPKKNIVIFPSVTWQTSISPWVNLGFSPKFIDVNLTDLSIDINKLEDYLKTEYEKVNTVFVTSLIGITPDVDRLKSLCKKYKVELKLDNCENIFGYYGGKHICSELSCSTSLYFGHQCTTGSEGGLIFTNDKDEFISHILNRAHGLTRELKNYDGTLDAYKRLSNKEVDPLFDFNTLGSNYRMSNIQAYMGKLDFKRAEDYSLVRQGLYNRFALTLDTNKYILPENYNNRKNVMFSLPIITRAKSKTKFNRVKTLIKALGIEYRPVISGNLLRQTCYRKFDNYRKFRNAEHIHNYGIYVGLHPKLKDSQVADLAGQLNEI